MKYRKFIIKYYKAIEHVEVNLSRNVIPLIGVNESGKTSILHGILAFDKDKDHVIDGIHIIAKNKYLTRQNPCEIVAGITLDGIEEFEEIGEAIKLDMANPIYTWLKSKAEADEPVFIMREYDQTEDKFTNKYLLYNCPDEVSSNKKAQLLVKEITKRLPNILYFDDFSDRVPESISFNEPTAKGIEFSRGKDREWQEIVSEIFSRALDEEYSLEAFIQQKDEDDRNNYLNDVTQTLNAEIVAEWKNLKDAFSGFAEESSDLVLKLDYYSGDKHTFKFKVIDSERDGRHRTFNIYERSKGFQWFFNFIMKLKFNPKYKQHPENAIYLLDEPGSYLHASAQTELLKKLCSIGEKNTILFCTHSQYLLDPEIINIAGIKIVSKEAGKISLCDYGNSTVQRGLGAFSALNDALQLKFGFSDGNLRNCILTEGITDYYVLKMFVNIEGVEIIPGAGCGHLKELISILIAYCNKFVVVLDYDGEGRCAYNQYKTYYGKAFTIHCYQYDGLKKASNDFMLENLFEQQDIDLINSEVNCEDIKNSFTLLYYSDKDVIKRVTEALSKESTRKLDVFRRKLQEQFE